MNVAAILKLKGNQLFTAEPDTRVVAAAERMKRETIGALLISTDGLNLLGLLSERDILYGLAKHGPELTKLKVREIMGQPEATCSPDDGLKRVMQMMTTKRARHLPVLDAHCLCGVVSIGDVVKYLLQEVDLEINVLRDLCAASRLGSPHASEALTARSPGDAEGWQNPSHESGF
ncbi:CBS domain-containing protein [Sphingopyxis sp. SE2]|uniref:CBS domain-containing protein n=1 Tax=Sphingopyxis sp. SE2 TaxID=1586240 RepID=UPI0028BFC8CE|nr:CBS domain-containing protein [Sphingopyxis sp. SE2]MDT7531202.1 CBS domain-containing protein [Sphingopyxis sp. SE2]